MKFVILLLNLSIAGSLFADSVKVLAPTLTDKIVHAKIEVGGKTFKLEQLENREFDISKLKNKKIKISLGIESRVYLPSTKTAERIELKPMVYKWRNGKYVSVKNKIKKVETSQKKLDLSLNCSNAIDIEKNGNQLVIDFTQLETLGSCDGAEIFSPYATDIRDVSLNKNGKERNSYTLDQDKSMGDEFSRQFISQNRDKMLADNHPMTVHLQNQMEEIAKNSDMPNLKPKVHVINADVLNAFALPGGNVFVFRGLIEAAENEASLMGVLGHEWAHVTARHGTKALTRNKKIIIGLYATYYAGKIASEVSRKTWKRIAFSIGADLSLFGGISYIMWKSRQAESEADRLGAQYAYRAHYDPTGIAQMFTTFQRIYPQKPNFIEKIFASHPDHETRINNNYVLSSLFYPYDNNLDETSSQFELAFSDMQSVPMATGDIAMGLASKFANGMRSFFTMKAFEDANVDVPTDIIQEMLSMSPSELKKFKRKRFLSLLAKIGTVTLEVINKSKEKEDDKKE
ncbi:MAG: M48 family metalloprotease [Halobacteriovoraceae bacterium]|nr:M48 family metalloprotease [Halobacteriovoraceae bacterium]MCB9095187.1 M48 family metalloprotease [Halobacteriovoraceae bacterium]